nr:MAG TPA: hypothetical protein [Caudoviricetes sp.]
MKTIPFQDCPHYISNHYQCSRANEFFFPCDHLHFY